MSDGAVDGPPWLSFTQMPATTVSEYTIPAALLLISSHAMIDLPYHSGKHKHKYFARNKIVKYDSLTIPCREAVIHFVNNITILSSIKSLFRNNRSLINQYLVNGGLNTEKG